MFPAGSVTAWPSLFWGLSKRAARGHSCSRARSVHTRLNQLALLLGSAPLWWQLAKAEGRELGFSSCAVKKEVMARVLQKAAAGSTLSGVPAVRDCLDPAAGVVILGCPMWKERANFCLVMLNSWLNLFPFPAFIRVFSFPWSFVVIQMLVFFSSYTADGDGISLLMTASFFLHKFYELASSLVGLGRAL